MMDLKLDPGLVLYLPLYELDRNSFMSKDAYGHLCTVTGALWRPDGRCFDGVDDHISCGCGASLNFTTGDLTVVVWIYRNPGNDPDNTIIGGSTLNTPQFEVQGAGTVAFAKPSAAQVFADTPLADSTWTQLGVTFDNSEATGNLTFFNNGNPDGTRDFDHDFADYLNCIGAGYNASAWFWDGVIGEIYVYNRLLTAAEFMRNYRVTGWRYR